MDITLTAQARKVTGRKVKKLRAAGVVPANVYGKDVKSESVEVKTADFEKVHKKAGETSIVELQVGKSKKPVLIHNIQTHPVTGDVLHVDFLQVNLKEKVTAQVPVELTGESPAQKSGLGTVVVMLNELEIEALPTDIPEKFVIDAANLTEVDQVVKVSDLKYDKAKVEVKAEGDEIVVKVEPPQKEEVVAAPVAEAPKEGEAPVEGSTSAEATADKEKPAEGEAPAEKAEEPKAEGK